MAALLQVQEKVGRAIKLTDMFLGQLEREAPISRRALERLPLDRAQWKPHPKSMVLGNLESFAPRYVMIGGGVLMHLAHHRGQLTVYLRMNDIPVPAIYGSTADEAR
jgi:hypothetical protein